LKRWSGIRWLGVVNNWLRTGNNRDRIEKYSCMRGVFYKINAILTHIPYLHNTLGAAKLEKIALIA
jgi:hypothetical protein